jgi:HSP20 family protein
MPKDKNLINKLMGTQAIAQEDNEEQELDETEMSQGSANQEDWLSEYEGQLTIDMYQTKDNVVIKSTIAGVKPEDIDVTIANDMVTIRGERKRDFEVSSEDYFYQECYWGNFSRSVVLPVDVDIENVGADLKDGILTVILPKAAKARAKKIKVASI